MDTWNGVKIIIIHVYLKSGPEHIHIYSLLHVKVWLQVIYSKFFLSYVTFYIWTQNKKNTVILYSCFKLYLKQNNNHILENDTHQDVHHGKLEWNGSTDCIYSPVKILYFPVGHKFPEGTPHKPTWIQLLYSTCSDLIRKNELKFFFSCLTYFVL